MRPTCMLAATRQLSSLYSTRAALIHVYVALVHLPTGLVSSWSLTAYLWPPQFPLCNTYFIHNHPNPVAASQRSPPIRKVDSTPFPTGYEPTRGLAGSALILKASLHPKLHHRPQERLLSTFSIDCELPPTSHPPPSRPRFKTSLAPTPIPFAKYRLLPREQSAPCTASIRRPSLSSAVPRDRTIRRVYGLGQPS